jgi:hypothetical protein
MNRFAMALLLALAAPAVAQAADSFTFVNTNATPDQVTLKPASPGGRPTGATVYSMKSVATTVDGKKTESNARCANWILPPGDQFGQNGVCDAKDAAGPVYESRFTCAAPTPGGNGVDCWGSLTGTGGAWKGRSGAFTGHTTQGGFVGEGHWN